MFFVDVKHHVYLLTYFSKSLAASLTLEVHLAENLSAAAVGKVNLYDGSRRGGGGGGERTRKERGGKKKEKVAGL